MKQLSPLFNTRTLFSAPMPEACFQHDALGGRPAARRLFPPAIHLRTRRVFLTLACRKCQLE